MTNISKNGKTFRIGALLLVVALISTVMLSGTFAKYTSEYAGQDTALVAKWNLTMTDNANIPFAISPATAQLDLFKHAYDGKIVASAGADKIIAPGVKGSFVLNMTNNSDVAADITFDITEDTANAAVPMEYSFDSSFPTTSTYLGAANLKTALNSENIQLAETNGTKSQTVYWRWAFDGTALTGATDATDTALGTASAAATDPTGYKLDIKIIATQVAPTTP